MNIESFLEFCSSLFDHEKEKTPYISILIFILLYKTKIKQPLVFCFLIPISERKNESPKDTRTRCPLLSTVTQGSELKLKMTELTQELLSAVLSRFTLHPAQINNLATGSEIAAQFL